MGEDTFEGLSTVATIVSSSVVHTLSPGTGHHGRVSLVGMVTLLQRCTLLVEVLPESVLMPNALHELLYPSPTAGEPPATCTLLLSQHLCEVSTVSVYH